MEQEYIERMGCLICQKRKEKGLTQKELAAKLGVTDKAVSKWERGSCCPDIALLLPLSECLGISVGELLGGESGRDLCKGDGIEEETAAREEETGGEVVLDLEENIKRWLLLGVTAAGLIAVLVCLLCDYIVTGELDWSYLVCCSVAFGWLFLLPYFSGQKNALFRMLSVLSILILPYLAAVGQILGQPQVFRIGLPVALISVTGVWCLYYVFRGLRNRVMYGWAIAFVILGGISFVINGIVAALTEGNPWKREESMFNILVCLILALSCAGAGYWKDMSRKEKN